MKLKFINILLAGSLLIGSSQVLTSCKDTDEDLYAQLRDENLTLQKNLEEQIKILDGKISALETKLAEYVKKTEFNGMVDTYIKDVSEYENLKAVLDALKATQKEVNDAKGDYASVAARFVAVETALLNLQKTLENYPQLVSDVEVLNTFMNEWKTQLPTIAADAASALAKATQNEADIKAINTTIEQLKAQDKVNSDKITELENKLQTVLDNYASKADLTALAAELRKEAQDNMDALELRLQEQINTCIERLNGIDTKMSEISSDINALQTDLTQAKQDIAANAAEITKLSTALDSVLNRLKNLENRISSIEIQGIESPVLGYLKSPFGIQSNFLLAYAGENAGNVTVDIPNYTDGGVEYDGKRVITPEDYSFLQQCGITGAESFAPGAVLFNGNDGNLGKVYVTLNPANIDLNGKDFTIVNSKNTPIPVELKNLRPSTHELTHGYTRSAAAGTSLNGFYEADATVAAGDIPAIRIVIDQELKSAAKKVLNERSASSLLALGNSLYNQFNGFLPALGIRAAWQETKADGQTIEQSVYSQYGIAAATFKPLSYKFLYGKSFRQIPFPDVNAFLDKYKFDFVGDGVNISFGGDDFQLEGIEGKFHIDLQLTLNNLGQIKLTIKDIPVYDENGNLVRGDKDVTIDLDSPENKDFRDKLAASITKALQEGLNTQINQQFADMINSLTDQISVKIRDLLASMETSVNQQLNEILGNLQDQVNGKIDMIGDQITNNALYSRLQALVNRVNGVLADPNHYLQATLLFNNGGQYGKFSNTIAMPTVFVGNGNAVMLTPTSLNGEIVTPAFKKFVAVTNVYKASDHNVNAQAGDATCVKLAKAANAQKYMNEVVPGERRTIPFYFEGGEGYIYEIVYQALDYTGATSTSKYYVRIK